MGELKSWQAKDKLQNFENLDDYLDKVVGKVEYPTTVGNSETQRKVHKLRTTTTYNTLDKTTFHYNQQTQKYTKVFQSCNIKTLFYSDGETLVDGKEILTYSPNPAIIATLYKHRQFGIARNGQKHLGSAGLTFRRKTKNEDIKRGHMAYKAQAHYQNYVVNATTKDGCYILKNEDIQIRGNPKKENTAQCRQVFPSHRERRKVPHTFEPNRYSQKNKSVMDELHKQEKQDLDNKKRMNRMIRKPKKN